MSKEWNENQIGWKYDDLWEGGYRFDNENLKLWVLIPRDVADNEKEAHEYLIRNLNNFRLKSYIMKDPQQEADELIEKYQPFNYDYEEGTDGLSFPNIQDAIECALIDNQNTIDALDKVKDYYDKVEEPMSYGLVEELNHHTQIRTILKIRLK